MGAALYFVENVQAVSPQLVTELGLDYALAPGCNHRLAANGPCGASGAVLSLETDGLGFFPDRQTWHELATVGERKVWFGHAKDSPPGPGDLRTPTAIDGDRVRLFDEREWVVPRAIAIEGSQVRCVTPAAARRKPDGGWYRGEVKAAYRRLDSIAREFFDRLAVEDESRQITIAEALDWATEALGVNYRVRAGEIGALGLLDDGGQVSYAVLLAVIDFRSRAELKKTDGPPAA